MNQAPSSQLQIKIALFFSVFTFSAFACTLSTFIMQAVSYFHQTPTSAGTLETYQNMSMVVFTFIAFSYFLKVGYKKAIMSIMGLMVIISFLMPILNNYWMIKFYLIGLGIVFVGMKIGIYSTVALISQQESEQAQFLSLLEATWMFASMIGMWVLAYFIKELGDKWLYSIWFFTAIGIIGLIIWSITTLDENLLTQEKHKPVLQQIKEMGQICKNKLVLAVIVMLFIANIVEMGVGAWLPGFYRSALHVSESLSVYIASMALFATFAGRLIVALLLRYFSWEKVLFVFYTVGLIFVALVLFTIKAGGSPINELSQVPTLALMLPMIGFFLAPNSPLLNSSILARTNKEKQALLMTVLSIVFAFASSLGARGIGQLMEHVGPMTGFKIATLIPLLLLMLLIIPYAKFLKSSKID